MASFLGPLLDKLYDLEDIPDEAAKTLATKVQDLIEEEFASSSDPYGNAWAPLAPSTVARGRRLLILMDTGDMANSVNVTPQGSTIRITADDPAIHHQYGAPRSNLPQRQILPDEEWPEKWKLALIDSVFDAWSKKSK